MDLNAAGESFDQVGRNDAFNQGTTGTPWSVASTLNESSAMFNSKVPGQFTPQSVLDPTRSSGNGMSSDDYSRVLPGNVTLPSMNGSSTESYEAAKYMRLMGAAAI